MTGPGLNADDDKAQIELGKILLVLQILGDRYEDIETR
jgi:hypothetical protein